jgi:hypothetical protein
MEEPNKAIKRSQPKLVTFVQSVMAFKRLARKLSRWRQLEETRITTMSRGPSVLLTQVRHVNEAVKKARVGVHVIQVHSGDIAATRKEMKRHRVLVKRERDRAKNEAQHAEELYGKEWNKTVKELVSFRRKRGDEFAEHLDDIHQKLDKDLFDKLDAANQQDNDQEVTQNFADVLNLFQKNTNMEELDKGTKRTIKLRNTDKQDKIDYLPGTAIYFGSTVALQGKHGGYMSYANPDHIKASAHRILPYARFVIVNCDDPSDMGLLRYGDAVWLQAGLHEVLGAHYVNRPQNDTTNTEASGRDEHTSNARKIVPALVNSRKENAFKAHQYGRWIVLHRENPLENLGEYVTHMDEVMFEQGWFFLSSQTPYDSGMIQQGSFEEITDGNIDAFKPGMEIL